MFFFWGFFLSEKYSAGENRSAKGLTEMAFHITRRLGCRSHTWLVLYPCAQVAGSDMISYAREFDQQPKLEKQQQPWAMKHRQWMPKPIASPADARAQTADARAHCVPYMCNVRQPQQQRHLGMRSYSYGERV